MVKKTISGVSGVLGGIISSPAEMPSETPRLQSTKRASAVAVVTAPQPGPVDKPRLKARDGRPPGRKQGESVVREKVTVRIDTDLMAEYRDWSWDARCQLGELMERALTQYLKRRQK